MNYKMSVDLDLKLAKQYIDIVGVMIVAIDCKGIVTYINKAGAKILGYDKEDIIGKDWFENFLPKRMRVQIKEVSEKIIKGDLESVEYYENPVLTKSGDEKIILWHNTDLKNSENNIMGHLSAGFDVSSWKG